MAAFDNFYSGRDSVFGLKTAWGLNSYVTQHAPWDGKQALDLGCGQGRDARYLAQQGLEVHALDISSVAIRELAARSIAEGLQIIPRVADLRSESLPVGVYSIVVARTILDHIEKQFIPELVKRIKASCKPGAAFFSTVFTVDDPGSSGSANSSEFSGEILYYFERGTLKELFSDWNVVAYEEVMALDRTHGPDHFHGKARIVAVKP